MSDSGNTTRAPIFIFAALMLAVFALLVAMWASVSGGAFIPYIIGFGVYFLVFHVYLPYRVHRDATFKERNATVWAAIAFFIPILGAALYFIVGGLMGGEAAAE
ncbi:PLDc N-terminal domain-containing protein [Haloferax sp. DFSO60]|uniref:PLDc N-terminal domain-containing protein n=1 Tax=Haloferax sp. DFSO60 TaxID=3388652 RepID=UPI00397BE352